MSREIFGDVTKPAITIGSRKWYTVPVSLGTHGLIVLALIVMPMLAPGLLPMPDATTVFTIAPTPPALPPPPARRAETPVMPASNPDAAPTTAPDAITPEVERPPYDPTVDTDRTSTVVGVFDVQPPPAPPAAEPSAPMRVGGQVRPPAKLAEQPLVYPPMAISARVEGTVIIEATIGTDGRVSNAKVLRGKPLLDQAALDAVRTWQYTPTLLNGVPVAVIMTVVVQFRLN